MNQVVVFHQTACPACEDYIPRFKRIAVRYRAHLNIQIANLAHATKRVQDAAEHYSVTAIPTTLVLDANDKLLKRTVGAITDKQIENVFTFATTH